MDLTEQEIAGRLRTASGTERSAQTGETAASFEASTGKRAAVLVPLLRHGATWQVLLTRRTTLVESHKGQVSFPGGARDAGESRPEATALRESEEELGIRPADVRLLGRLAPRLTVSDYLVTPVVGVIPWPYVFRLEKMEVARVFMMPLAWIADSRNRREILIEGGTQPVIIYQPYDGEVLWGVSAGIALDLVRRLVPAGGGG
jgi:8-oxo-dGTP pyrophosphatase MutT (NUDIX family)